MSFSSRVKNILQRCLFNYEKSVPLGAYKENTAPARCFIIIVFEFVLQGSLKYWCDVFSFTRTGDLSFLTK